MSQRPKTARRHWHQWTESEAAAVLDVDTSRPAAPTISVTSSRCDRSPSTVPAFVEVAQPARSHRDAHIEITRGGVVLRLREDIDVDHLARLVAALAGTSSC